MAENGLTLMYDHSGRMSNADRVAAWKALGQDASGFRTAAEALEAGDLDFTVETRRALAAGADEFRADLGTDEYVAQVRVNRDGTEQVLSYTGKRYRALQPQRALAVMDDIVNEAGGAHYDAIGWIDKRKALFATLKLDRAMILDPGGAADRTDFGLFGLNDYKGGAAFTVGVTGTRTWCTNQVTGIVRGASAAGRVFRIRHTGNMETRIQQARMALNLSTQYLDTFEAQAQQLFAQRCPDWKFDRLVKDLFPVDPDAGDLTRQRQEAAQDTLQYLFREAETNANIRQTSWAAYNAVTEYLDHYRPTKAGGEAGRYARALGTTLGNEARMRDEAFTWLMVGAS